jgi:hypothetical protein
MVEGGGVVQRTYKPFGYFCVEIVYVKIEKNVYQ